MGYMTIKDGMGEPLEVESGIYLRFMQAETPTEKSEFMRTWRLLVCTETKSYNLARGELLRRSFVCDDPAEFDAIKEIVTGVSRLAAFAYGRDGGKAHAPDLEATEAGARLTIDLQQSRWYRSLLCDISEAGEHIPHALLFPPIHDNTQSMQLAFDRGEHVAGDAATGFVTPHILAISTDETDPRRQAASICERILSMHCADIEPRFALDDGLRLETSMGVFALWADFAACFASRPVRICEGCGLPIVQDAPPRGHPRKYCSDACRMRDKRRRRKQAEQAQGQPTKPARA